MIALLFSKLGAYLVSAIGIAIALIAAHQKGKAAGVAQEKVNTDKVIASQALNAAKAQTDAASAVVSATQEKQSVEQDVSHLPASAAADELRDTFCRD